MMHQPADLERARSGDRDATRRVLEAWWPRIRLWARLQNARHADEIAQETVVRVLRFVHQVDPSRPFGSWLRRVVATAGMDVLRDRHRHAGQVLEPVQHTPAVERNLDLQRAAERAIARFDDLPPRQRELVTRVDLRGESAAEVARDLGLSSGAVRNQLHTARRTLREALLSHPDVVALVREA